MLVLSRVADTSELNRHLMSRLMPRCRKPVVGRAYSIAIGRNSHKAYIPISKRLRKLAVQCKLKRGFILGGITLNSRETSPSGKPQNSRETSLNSK